MRRTLGLSMAMIAALIVAIPAASAGEGDNPSFSIPDPAAVTTGAEDLAKSRSDDANSTAFGNGEEISGTVNTVNESVRNGNPEVPLENLDAVLENSIDLVGRSITDAYSFASAVEDYLLYEIDVKLQEGDFLGDRSHISVQKHGSSGIALAQTALSAACRDSIAGGDGPADCGEASLVGKTLTGGNETAESGSDVANNQKDNIVGTGTHIFAEAENLICGGPCQ